MAFFNFRRGKSNAASAAGPAAQPESVEAIRKRAKHRLIGAVVLVLLGVIGFPLLFDTQPRPIAVDIPIEIPGKNAVKPLTVPAPAAATAPGPSAPVTPADKVAAAASLAPQEEILSSKPEKVQEPSASSAIKKEANKAPESVAKAEAEVKAEPKVADKPPAKPPVKAESKPVIKPSASDDDGARAIALLNGVARPQAAPKPSSAESGARVVVQVGAFADAVKAHEVRAKLERAGLKTYTQVADTKDGKRTRVRVGPFASRAEAERAVGKIKALGLAAAVLTL